MPMPTFIIVGPGRTGTTSLYRYLGQHPDVYMSPNKEPRFFAFEGLDPRETGHPTLEGMITRLEDYQALFDGRTTEKALGEASTDYFQVPHACERIKHYVPDVKLIFGLRNPPERVFSFFTHLVRRGFEPERDFDSALAADEHRTTDKRHYKNWGFYHDRLKRYYDAFDPAQIFVYLFDDLVADPARVCQDIFSFLEVADDFVPDTSVRHNRGVPEPPGGASPVGRWLRRLLPARFGGRAAGERENASWQPTLSPATRRELMSLYADDVRKVQDLVGKDLSAWLP